MKPAPFAYARAKSVEHAVGMLGEHEDARLLAGGQSLIATINMRLANPSLLIDINDIPDLDRIELKNGYVKIGSLVRHAQAERSPVIARHVPLIALAMPHIAHAAIRNRGTLCGSLAYADPAAELPACMVALEAQFEIAGPAGRRTVAAQDFFKGLFETALGPHDMLIGVRVPVSDTAARVSFAELTRRHGDYAIVGLAASARAVDDRLSDLRLVYFSVGAAPVRARSAEAALATGDVERAVAAIPQDISPEADLHGSRAVKLHLAGVLLRRVAAQLKEWRP